MRPLEVREAIPDRARVWDVGCGPGHVTAFLAGLGLRASGFAVDALTRRQPYPGAEVATPRAYFLARAR